MNTIFHLAFPVHDFQLAKEFYHKKLGFNLGRESQHALILNCGSNQIVAHKVEAPLQPQQGIYPRHFGLIFLEKDEFERFIDLINRQKIPFEVPPKIRFPGKTIEHQSFFLKDPSNNLLEFKHYTNPSAIFGETDFKQVGET
ncbi:VOC family protein [Legionella jordanis]|uniref:Glyoxalase/Bleomycin resistance family protein n=1 Tax=Legionella jordanis TaxID=456 RepID=A0A0W0VGF6_9GAMM|nr:VOC family protein [Legionella jordanis]KTD19244.1 Glyoxalase/Bleomycin resistance family protein [Legionella jordanis]RMW99820.1 glyoxalase [Legionella jordanis]RMX18773.1 glyoxalase [Legionella jordanis]VEH12870.1 Glyoxalase/Bleomycin resistance family protein [Legionella jordanis]HAT8714876.1 glyoxalase [Legionella jordanis]